MTAEPLAPEASAIILQRRVDRDDNTFREVDYYRIKVLTEEGRNQANVEIRFNPDTVKVINIRARTIRPDGTILNFDGQVYERELLKGRWVRYIAKTFTLPDIQVGSIIEYTYTLDLRGYLFDSHWLLNDELFTRRAQFSLRPYQRSTVPMSLRRTLRNVPTEMVPWEDANHVTRLEATNLPAFQTEEFAPPEDELKARVDFIYEEQFGDTDPEKYWKDLGTGRNQALEHYLGKSKAMEEALRQIVAPDDPPETKLRKIYVRVQAMRNTSYEAEKTEKEAKRSKERLAENVGEIWKHGYGNAVELTWLFLGLVRAAGLEAYGCWVADRSEYLFDPKLMEGDRLSNNVVLVRLNGKEIYLDPGAAFAPFGLLPWGETAVSGIRLDNAGGSWIRTPLPDHRDSQTRYVATLTLSTGSDLEGKLTVTYTGLEAMRLRVDERNNDEVGRRKVLEQLVMAQVPGISELELKNNPDWTNSEAPLVAEFKLTVQNWASRAGHRLLIPVGVFSGSEKHVFEHAERVHPIYFGYPYGELADLTLEIPAEWQIVSLPEGRTRRGDSIVFKMNVTADGKLVHISRELDADIFLLEKQRYPILRNFFGAVRSADEEQILLEAGAPNAGTH